MHGPSRPSPAGGVPSCLPHACRQLARDLAGLAGIVPWLPMPKRKAVSINLGHSTAGVDAKRGGSRNVSNCDLAMLGDEESIGSNASSLVASSTRQPDAASLRGAGPSSESSGTLFDVGVPNPSCPSCQQMAKADGVRLRSTPDRSFRRAAVVNPAYGKISTAAKSKQNKACRASNRACQRNKAAKTHQTRQSTQQHTVC